MKDVKFSPMKLLTYQQHENIARGTTDPRLDVSLKVLTQVYLQNLDQKLIAGGAY